MKTRKRHRADPMKSVRHGKRRARKAAWIKAREANPRNSMTGRQVIKFDRIEKNILKGKRRELTPAELKQAIQLSRLI